MKIMGHDEFNRHWRNVDIIQQRPARLASLRDDWA